MTRYGSLAALVSVLALASCEKNAVQDITGSDPGARIRFFNFGVNAPAVNFYANDTKVTAVGPAADGSESTLGTSYGGVGAGGLYSGIAPGQYTLTGRISGATNRNLAISTVTTTIEAGKRYSFYQSGFYDTTTKKVDAFIVEDNFDDRIDYSAAYVRFVNAISNANPMTLYAKNTAAPADTTAGIAIGGAIAYKSAGAFVAVPNGVYDLRTRYPGSSTNVITRTAVSFSAGRVYTITARGDITVTSTTATNRPFLDNTINR